MASLSRGDREKREMLFADIDDPGLYDPQQPQQLGPPWDQDDAHIAELLADNRTSLNRSLRMTHESKELAGQTNQQLAEQSAQLERIDRDLNDVNQSLSLAERSIRSIRSWSGSVANWFSSPAQEDHRYKQSAPDVDAQRAQNEVRLAQVRAARASQQQRQQQKQQPQKPHNNSNSSGSNGDDGVYSHAGLPDRAHRRQQLIDQARVEEDQSLDALSDVLSGLKQDALVMNHQLKHQQHVLEHLDHEMSRTNERMERNTFNVRRLR